MNMIKEAKRAHEPQQDLCGIRETAVQRFSECQNIIVIITFGE